MPPEILAVIASLPAMSLPVILRLLCRRRSSFVGQLVREILCREAQRRVDSVTKLRITAIARQWEPADSALSELVRLRVGLRDLRKATRLKDVRQILEDLACWDPGNEPPRSLPS